MPLISVYCASSALAPQEYRDAAHETGRVLVEAGYTIVYGGGGIGSMRALADGALSAGGRVVGILPRFMAELEWKHPSLSELVLVEDMRTRKHLMLTDSEGVVTLPGGTGTFEELFEAITLKRLGLYVKPIVIVNTRSFFDPMIELLNRAIAERFMDERHREMWTVVRTPDEIPAALRTAPDWTSEARNFAVPR